MVAMAAPGQRVEISVAGTAVAVERKDQPEVRPVHVWARGWCAAVVSRDQALLDALRVVPDDVHRHAQVQIDEYQYALKDALVSVAVDPTRCLAAVGKARELWNKRSVAAKLAANIDGAMIDAIEALANARPDAFNDALWKAVTAHAKFWGKGDNYSSPEGWVAVPHLALACLAHDRDIPVEVESDYLPRSLIERRFSPEPSLAFPPAPQEDPADRARRLTVQIGRNAGEFFGQTELEPQGYRRLPLSPRPPCFDLAYANDSGEVALIDGRAGDLERDAIEGPDGQVFEPGTHVWVQYVLSEMQEREPDVAKTIRNALDEKRLRYFEVHQAFEENGDLGEMRVREYQIY
jgi:hypothetical protein